MPFGGHDADRIGKLDNVLKRARHGLDALIGEAQAIQQRRTHGRAARCGDIARIGGKNGCLVGSQRGRARGKAPVLGSRRRERQDARRLDRLTAKSMHKLGNVAGV